MDGSSGSLLLVAGLLLAGKAGGGLAQRFGMPSVLGILAAGLLLGPAGFSLTHEDVLAANLGQLGVILLMFLAGLETDPGGLRSVGRVAFVVAAAGVVVPFAGGMAVGMAWGLDPLPAAFLGAILTATSVSITAETLKELGRSRSREGSIILGAAIIDDVLGVLVLSALVVAESGGSLLEPVIKLALFGGLAYAAARWVMPLVVEHHTQIESPDTRVAVALAVALAFAWGAYEIGGLADVTGAFLVGVMLSRTDLGHQIVGSVSTLGYALFIPVFFAYMGTHVTAGDLTAEPLLCLAVVAVAIASKLGACGLAAVGTGEDGATALRVGAGMVGRGEIALVVAAIGLREGVVDERVFSIAIVMTLATTMAAPILLKLAYSSSLPETREPVQERPRDLATERAG